MRSPRRLDDQEQNGALTTAFPSFRLVKRGNPYVWEGALQPTDLSPIYRVRITHRHGRRPIVEVLDPPIVPRDEGGRVPHTFRPGVICLHINQEWRESDFIHRTIVPWASLWLYFYEIWHATGEWLGGGHEPSPGADGTSAADDHAA